MEKNYFQILSDVACVTEKKSNLTYISWADAWSEVKKLHPEATYTIYENTDGNAFFESKYGIDCKVGVTINGIEHISRLPVMDWANKTLYSEPYEYQTKYGTKTVDKANAFDINKTIQRAFTKAIAMHWLGLYVYRGEDFPEDHKPEKQTPIITETAVKEFIAKYKSGEMVGDVDSLIVEARKTWTVLPEQETKIKSLFSTIIL